MTTLKKNISFVSTENFSVVRETAQPQLKWTSRLKQIPLIAPMNSEELKQRKNHRKKKFNNSGKKISWQ